MQTEREHLTSGNSFAIERKAPDNHAAQGLHASSAAEYIPAPQTHVEIALGMARGIVLSPFWLSAAALNTIISAAHRR